MSDRNLRESTKKVTEKQKKKTEIYKEIAKSKETSKKLSEICRQEENLYLDSALELAEYSAKHFDITDQESEISTTDIREESSRNDDIFDDHNNPIEEDWDPLGVTRTPRQELHSPEISAAGPSSASWSTVNQFFPLNCESTPILKRIESVRSTDSDLPPPIVRLEEIFEEN